MEYTYSTDYDVLTRRLSGIRVLDYDETSGYPSTYLIKILCTVRESNVQIKGSSAKSRKIQMDLVKHPDGFKANPGGFYEKFYVKSIWILVWISRLEIHAKSIWKSSWIFSIGWIALITCFVIGDDSPSLSKCFIIHSFLIDQYFSYVNNK